MTFASLTDIITNLGLGSTWFWARFTDFVDMITQNDLLLWSVIFALVAGSIGLLVKVIRYFGVKGRR